MTHHIKNKQQIQWLAGGVGEWVNIQFSYAIGVANLTSIYVDMGGQGQVSDTKLERAIRKVMDLTPNDIRKRRGLNKPIYARTSA